MIYYYLRFSGFNCFVIGAWNHVLLCFAPLSQNSKKIQDFRLEELFFYAFCARERNFTLRGF